LAEHKTAWEIVQVAVIAAMFVGAAVRWGSVPDLIPIHWDVSGQVDGYGGKFVGLLLLPIVAAVLYPVLKYLPRIDPASRNYESFAGTYLLVRVLLTVYLGYVYVVTNLAIGREQTFPVAEMIIGAVGVLLIVLGGALGKFRPNWFAGIRTPWTLTSKRSWILTHRLGGRIFIVTGVATMLGALISSDWAFYALFIVMIPGVIALFIYSYMVWRDDPEKIPAQEVTPSGD
jgi:uncharacterized membrane protein